jgi:ABC-2 type transport system permease protein
MRILFFLLRREFGLFWANKVFAAAFLLMPVLFAIILGFVYRDGKVTGVPIIIVDKDVTPASTRFRDMLENDPNLKVIGTKYETVDLYQTLLNKRAVAVVVVPYRFEADLLAQKNPELNCYLNMANTLTANVAGAAVSLCATTMNAAPASFHYNTFYQFNPAGNYLYFLWPGFLFSILHQLLLLALAVSFSREFEAGTFKDLLGHSRSPFVLLFVKVFPYMLLSLWTIGVYYGLSHLFHLPAPAHPFLLFLAQGLLVLGTSLLGAFYSIIYPIPLKASQLLMSIASPAFTLSGFTWPSAEAPLVLASLGKIVPLTPYLKIMRMVLLQKADKNDILPQVEHQLILIGVYALGSLLLLSKKIKKAGIT